MPEDRIPGSARKQNEPVTVLEGVIRDQAELSGILNTLCGLRYTLLSVKILREGRTI